ncbi:MAG: hypothetical protein A3H28_05985 [Acidobacteria bacterium RIFCSPLOWO2_02_FULL_61_28]|nr:MAG: hypothetical protein A3H28_05985 [Acidobacteria bacterium RIFCSPLOWO2_02_FULL_61_28]
MRLRKEKGFSLIELLIVVAIILIIAAIAVPNLLRSRMAANESSAAAGLRTITTANITYSSTYNVGYAGTLTALGPKVGASPTSADADLLDGVLGVAAPVKSGYKFVYLAGPTGATPTTIAPNATFTTFATPVSLGSSGQSGFCVDQTNVVGKDTTGAVAAPPATACDYTAAGFPPM